MLFGIDKDLEYGVGVLETRHILAVQGVAFFPMMMELVHRKPAPGNTLGEGDVGIGLHLMIFWLIPLLNQVCT